MPCYKDYIKGDANVIMKISKIEIIRLLSGNIFFKATKRLFAVFVFDFFAHH